MIPYGSHEIIENDIKKVEKVLRSNFLTQGPVVPKFESSIKKFCGVKHAIAVNSATSALHIACLSMGLGTGDIVWTVPNTFVASANCGLYCGANIDFVDINPKTFNIDVNLLSEKLIIAKKKGILPKIIIPVHFAGQSCDMEAIKKLSKIYGFKIIEDASHAIGAKYKNHKVGSCKYSDITIFSFHPVKIITTGEGGMALTNNFKYAQMMNLLRNHGITRDKKLMYSRSKNEIWNYQQLNLGFNYRMSDIHAAIGLSQLNRLEKYIDIRNKIAGIYKENLKSLNLIFQSNLPNCKSSYHLFIIRLKNISKKSMQRLIYNELLAKGIAANLHYIPVHRHPFFEKLGFKKNDFPEAEKFHKEAISIPIFPTLKINKQKYIIQTLKKILA